MNRPSCEQNCVGLSAFGAALMVGAAGGLIAVRCSGLDQMRLQQVSPRGGNLLVYTLTKAAILALYGVLGPLEASGQEHVPLTGGIIITPTHRSDSDVTAVAAALPRWAWYIAKEELFGIPVLGSIMRYLHAFPIRRTGPADRSAMKQVLDLLAEGEAVVMFPEGQLSETGKLQPFQPGAAMLALRAGVPVIPAAMDGTQRVLPYGKVFPRRTGRKVRVRFGPAVDFSNLPEDRHKRLEEATARIYAAVAGLLHELDPDALE